MKSKRQIARVKTASYYAPEVQKRCFSMARPPRNTNAMHARLSAQPSAVMQPYSRNRERGRERRGGKDSEW